MNDTSTRCKSTLILTYNMLQNKTEFRTDKLRNTLINCVAADYGSEVTRSSRARGFRY